MQLDPGTPGNREKTRGQDSLIVIFISAHVPVLFTQTASLFEDARSPKFHTCHHYPKEELPFPQRPSLGEALAYSGSCA